jgi:hypothetical protein
MLGQTVSGRVGEITGEIKDLLVDLDEARVRAVVLTRPGAKSELELPLHALFAEPRSRGTETR